MLWLTVDDAAAATAQFDILPGAVNAALRAKAAVLAELLRAHVANDKLSGQVLQIRSGALKASIQAEVTADETGVQARVFSAGDLKYALIQEVGGHTPAHDIVPAKARALAFLSGGQRVFAAIVHHPGSAIPAHRYLSGGLEDLAPTIAAELKAAALDALTTPI